MLNLQSGFGSNLVWPLSFDLSGLGGPTRSIAPAGIALRVIETRKPTHQRQGNEIVRIFWPQIISNQDLFDEYQQESIETTIARRRWRWIGHILRKDQGSIPRVAVEWKPEGHRKRGRPKMTWRRTVEAEAKAMGHSWGTLRTLAQDRLRWREFVAALVVYDKKGSK